MFCAQEDFQIWKITLSGRTLPASARLKNAALSFFFETVLLYVEVWCFCSLCWIFDAKPFWILAKTGPPVCRNADTGSVNTVAAMMRGEAGGGGNT